MKKEDIEKLIKKQKREEARPLNKYDQQRKKILAEMCEWPINPFALRVNSMNRLEALLLHFQIRNNITDKEYWTTLGETWQVCDNLFDYQKEVKALFSAKRRFKKYLMCSKDVLYLNKLPQRITIYRGMTVDEFKSDNYGVSWTLSKKTAKFFTKYPRNYQTINRPQKICKLVIPKRQVIAFFNNRNEKEIIYIYDGDYHTK